MRFECSMVGLAAYGVSEGDAPSILHVGNVYNKGVGSSRKEFQHPANSHLSAAFHRDTNNCSNSRSELSGVFAVPNVLAIIIDVYYFYYMLVIPINVRTSKSF